MREGRFVAPRRRVPGLPRRLDSLIRACLRAKPSRRPSGATEVRRVLARHCGEPSALECRRAIAGYLYESGVFEGAPEERTACRPVAALRRRRLLTRRAGWLLAILAAVGLGATALVTRPGGLVPAAAPELQRRHTPVRGTAAGAPSTPARGTEAGLRGTESPAPATPGPASAPPVATAGLRVVAFPWAEVVIDGVPPFDTPRAGAVRLDPGVHRVRFEHPRFGTAEYEVRLAPGEQRVLRHAYEEAAR